jgi:hypothetical protein
MDCERSPCDERSWSTVIASFKRESGMLPGNFRSATRDSHHVTGSDRFWWPPLAGAGSL